MAQADFTHPEHRRSNPLATAVARTARRAYGVLNHFVMETLGFRMTGLADMPAEAPIADAVSTAEADAANRTERMRAPLLAGVTALMTFGYLVLNALPDYFVILLVPGFAAAAAFSWSPQSHTDVPDRRGADGALHRFAGSFGGAMAPAVFGLLLGVIVWQVAMWDALYGVVGLVPVSWCTCAT